MPQWQQWDVTSAASLRANQDGSEAGGFWGFTGNGIDSVREAITRLGVRGDTKDVFLSCQHGFHGGARARTEVLTVALDYDVDTLKKRFYAYMSTAMNRNAVTRRLFALAISAAFVIAVICALVPARLVHAPVIRTLVSMESLIVPSLKTIAARTGDQDRYLLVLSSQWLFAPLYAYIFFIRLFPFAASARRQADARLAGLSPSQKPNRLALLFGLVLLVLNALGTLEIIHWPSFYNGGYLLNKLSPFYSAFHSSTIALIVFAWISSIAEILFEWMLLYSAAHVRFLLTGRVQERQVSAKVE